MVESFGGIINLVIFVILTLGWAYYAFQMLVGTASFFDRFNISHTGVIMGRFVGSFAAAGAIMHVIMLFIGPEGGWYIMTLFLMQGVIAAIASLVTIRSQVGVKEGVKYTAEPVVAPLVFVAGYTYLLWAMSGIVYA
jgi:predicted metal-binding membrane protein